MFRSRTFAALLTVLVAGARIATAAPPDEAPRGPDRAQREAVLKKIHTGFILELGELLELDTTQTIKLGERLQPFDAKRIALRMETWDALQQLKKAAKGKVEGDVVKIGRRIAQARVELAQVDQAELEELIKGLPPDKIAKAAMFLAEYPRRVEHMAREILRDRWQKQHGEGPGGPPGPPGSHWGEE